jgi:MbtH protein
MLDATDHVAQQYAQRGHPLAVDKEVIAGKYSHGTYSIWRDDRDVPNGWTIVGQKAEKQACLDQIKLLWTDMRPLSLRKQMGEMTSS